MMFYTWGPPKKRALGRLSGAGGCRSHIPGARAWRDGKCTLKYVFGGACVIAAVLEAGLV